MPWPKKNRHGEYIFEDYPEFRPNVNPADMFKFGFGNTYWRPIYSSVLNKTIKNDWKKYPKWVWKGITEDDITRPYEKYNKEGNIFGVKTGTTLEFWENKGWIKKYDPRGWGQWYLEFSLGRRIPEYDDWQINRWLRSVGPKGRFRIWLINRIKKNKSTFDDITVSPALRQVCWEWGLYLTSRMMT